MAEDTTSSRCAPVSPEELAKIFEAHRLWLQTDEKEGKRADLSGCDLRKAHLQNGDFRRAIFERSDLSGNDLSFANLSETKLDRANLSKAHLRRAVLQQASLREAILNQANFQEAELLDDNFQGAELRRVNFEKAELRRTNLREADLQNANLETSIYLLTAQLAGANVAGAKLPKAIAEFKGLERIKDATSDTQKLFVAMLSGCLYCWLTIGTTKDAALLTNSASSPLPIIQTALPIVGFYFIAPFILLALYFYFHLNLQRLWETLAGLPAVFPDGRTLDKRADPWLLNGLVCAPFVRLREDRPALSRVQEWLSILLAWGVVPATLFIFWARFLSRHDLTGTCVNIVPLVASVVFAWISFGLARRFAGRLVIHSAGIGHGMV